MLSVRRGLSAQRATLSCAKPGWTGTRHPREVAGEEFIESRFDRNFDLQQHPVADEMPEIRLPDCPGPPLRLGWYVPFVPPDFAGVDAPGTVGFGFCLVNRSGRLITAGGTAPDSSTATVDPGGAGGCGEPPTDPAG